MKIMTSRIQTSGRFYDMIFADTVANRNLAGHGDPAWLDASFLFYLPETGKFMSFSSLTGQ